MSAILKEDPPDLSVTNQNISPGLERIVRHCLEKNPEQRFHSAHDVAFDLEALSGLSTPRLEPVEGRASGPGFPRASSAAALLAALAIGLLAGRLIWKPGPQSPPTFHRLTFRRGPIQSARFAPDGNTIVYSASWDGAQKPELFSTRVESPESLRLNLPDRWIEAISRTGEMLVLNPLQFATGYAITGTLSQAPLSGSASRELLEDVGQRRLVPGRNESRRRARAAVALPARVSRPERSSTRRPAASATRASLRRETPSRFSTIRSSATTAARSRSWTSRERRRRCPRDGKARRAWPGRPPARRSGSRRRRAGSARSLYAVTPAGRQRAGAHDAREDWCSRTSPATGASSWSRATRGSGSSACFPERPGSGTSRVSNGRRARACPRTRRRSSSPSRGRPAVRAIPSTCASSTARRRCGWERESALAISPDGKWVLTRRIRTTPATIVLLPTGAGQPKTFPKDSIDRSAATVFGAFLPDGKRIVFNGHEAGKPTRVFVQNLDGRRRAARHPGGSHRQAGLAGRQVPADRDGRAGVRPGSAGRRRPLGADSRSRAERRPAAMDRRRPFSLRQQLERAFPARVFRLDLATGRRELWKEFMPGDPTGITSIGPVCDLRGRQDHSLRLQPHPERPVRRGGAAVNRRCARCAGLRPSGAPARGSHVGSTAR